MKGGFFGNFFDFDRDGKLNAVERAMDFMAFDEMMKANERRETLEDDNLDSDDFDF